MRNGDRRTTSTIEKPASGAGLTRRGVSVLVIADAHVADLRKALPTPWTS
jgi:hypothetical protein